MTGPVSFSSTRDQFSKLSSRKRMVGTTSTRSSQVRTVTKLMRISSTRPA